MLVLARKLNEGFFIGDSEVVVIRVSGGTVKLGIIAPKDVHIRRSELPVIASIGNGDQQSDSAPVG